MKIEDEKDINLENKEEESEAKTDEETIIDVDESRGEIVERSINDEYKIWKNENPFLYDMIISHAIEWPSLTVDWVPYQVESSDGYYSVQKLIFGTHTADNEPNHLNIAHVKLPLFDDDPSELVSGVDHKIEIFQQICHDGEVHRARHMPQNPNVIATRTVDSDVLVFDCNNHLIKAPPDGKCNPDLRLRGHGSEGFGLSWSTLKNGYLLSGSDDAKICLWDVHETPKDKALDPIRIIEVHEGPVEDVAWSLTRDYLFGSCGDDKYLHIFDLRSPFFTTPIQSLKAHPSEINCLSFNPFNEWVVATGSTDTTLKLFDMRRFTSPVHTFKSHIEEVVQIGWSPHNETILASCCAGRRLMVWDLSRIGEEQTSKDAEDGPPELMFIHGGHTSRVTDFSWNPCDDWVIASVADDNMLQVWQMGEHIYIDDDES